MRDESSIGIYGTVTLAGKTPTRPRLSVTVSVTVYVSLPQKCDSRGRAKNAAGALFAVRQGAAFTFTSLERLVCCPTSSITVSVTMKVPVAAKSCCSVAAV